MCSKSQQNNLYKLEQHCVSTMCKSLETVDSAFDQLKIIKLPDLLSFSQHKLGYRVSHKLLPKLILKLFNRKGGQKTHRYDTRNKNTPNIQVHQDATFNNSFLCKSITRYSSLPTFIRAKKTLKSFTHHVKCYYTSTTGENAQA